MSICYWKSVATQPKWTCLPQVWQQQKDLGAGVAKQVRMGVARIQLAVPARHFHFPSEPHEGPPRPSDISTASAHRLVNDGQCHSFHQSHSSHAKVAKTSGKRRGQTAFIQSGSLTLHLHWIRKTLQIAARITVITLPTKPFLWCKLINSVNLWVSFPCASASLDGDSLIQRNDSDSPDRLCFSRLFQDVSTLKICG